MGEANIQEKCPDCNGETIAPPVPATVSGDYTNAIYCPNCQMFYQKDDNNR
jgi:uncharacterized protein with PIN domain